MSNTDLSRRQFLQRTAILGAAIGGSSLLAACGQAATTPSTAAGQGAQPTGLNCTDVSALTDQQKARRAELQYVEKSQTAGQTCANCRRFVPPTQANQCGTCSAVAGPINPEGHCAAWAAKGTS
jgi:hypothetical protein